MRKLMTAGAVVVVLAIAGCASVPPDAFTPSSSVVQLRSEQTRRYDGISQNEILAASAGVLQDLGFTLEGSQDALGVLFAAKQRSARSAGKIVASILVAALTGVYTPTDKDQTFYVTLVVSPVDQVRHGKKAVLSSKISSTAKNNYLVRATFAHIVRNTANRVTAAEQLSDEKLYQKFFSKLDKSVFLEGQKI
ncbi:MAG: hypothetical protein L0H29_01150 [Sinobacteraceae bacterium]|nr:hypothetical protein [Nevskiaceae bacterium]